MIDILLSDQYGDSPVTWASSLANRIKVRPFVDCVKANDELLVSRVITKAMHRAGFLVPALQHL